MSRVIVVNDFDNYKNDVIVSHGIDEDTLKTVILPNEPFKNFRKYCYYDQGIGEWIICKEK